MRNYDQTRNLVRAALASEIEYATQAMPEIKGPSDTYKGGRSAHTVHATATRPAKFGQAPAMRGESHYSDRRAIESLDAADKAVLDYLYAVWPKPRNKLNIGRYLITKARANGVRADTVARVALLVTVRLEGLCFEPPKPYQSCGISRSTWNKTYLRHWKTICMELNKLDTAALDAFERACFNQARRAG